MNAHPVEHQPHIERRIDRAYTRMLAATSDAWTHRWGDVFVNLVRARNSMRTPAEVREIERERGLA